MRVDEKATKTARARHAAGIERLDAIFAFDPNDPPKRAKHCQHDRRWRRRKLARAARKRNRS